MMEPHRQAERQAELRTENVLRLSDRADVAEDLRAVARDRDRLDVLGRDVGPRADHIERVEMGMDEMAAAVRLQAVVEQMVLRAQLLGKPIDGDVGTAKCLAKALLPFEDRVGSGNTRLSEQGSAHSCLRRDRAVDALHRPSGLGVFDQPRGMAARDSEGIRGSLLVEFHQHGAGSGTAERTDAYGRMMPAIDEVRRASPGYPDLNLVRGDHGQQQIPAGAGRILAERE